MSIYSLRRATEQDKDFIFQAFKLSMRTYVEWAWGWDEAFQRNGLCKIPLEHLRVICVEDQMAGAIYVEETDQHHWVRTVFLLPTFQRKGIGSSLLASEVSRAKEAGKSLVLRVIKINPAKRLYERLGFHVVKEDDTTYSMRA
jgi:GNAT superfamily N-acetyltransferase